MPALNNKYNIKNTANCGIKLTEEASSWLYIVNKNKLSWINL